MYRYLSPDACHDIDQVISLGLAFLLLWAILYLIAPGSLFEINVKWFDIGKRDFDLINYFGMGFMKISILILFFVPYLAIKSMLRRKERKSSKQ